jgi:hypothetical protein
MGYPELNSFAFLHNGISSDIPNGSLLLSI